MLSSSHKGLRTAVHSPRLNLVVAEADLVVQSLFAVQSLFSHTMASSQPAPCLESSAGSGRQSLLSRKTPLVCTSRLSWANSTSTVWRFCSCVIDGIYFFYFNFSYSFKKCFDWISEEEWFLRGRKLFFAVGNNWSGARERGTVECKRPGK